MIETSTFHFVLVGSLLGLSAGVSPGPLLTMVLTQTIKHNKKEGLKVAMSPLITDLPIILITLFVFSKLADFDSILAIISFIGGIFIAYLGIESFKTKGITIDLHGQKPDSLKKGIIANFLNPHPYLFWATVGSPYVFKAFGLSLLTGILFFTSFYVMLIGSKSFIAILVARSKKFIGQKVYLIIMKILGIALFSILFFYDGIKYLE